MLSSVALTGTNHEGDQIKGTYTAMKSSWVYSELKSVRNVKPAIKKPGLSGGMAYTGIFNFGLRGMEPWTFSHGHTDNETLYGVPKAANIPEAAEKDA